MPVLDDHIDEILETYFYYVTSRWGTIRHQGIKSDANGEILAVTAFDETRFRQIARQNGWREFVVLRFNPCNCGIYIKNDTQKAETIRIKEKIIGSCLIEKVHDASAQ